MNKLNTIFKLAFEGNIEPYVLFFTYPKGLWTKLVERRHWSFNGITSLEMKSSSSIFSIMSKNNTVDLNMQCLSSILFVRKKGRKHAHHLVSSLRCCLFCSKKGKLTSQWWMKQKVHITKKFIWSNKGKCLTLSATTNDYKKLGFSYQ